MEKKILNNKIGIQIAVLILGLMLLSFGLACSLFTRFNFSLSWYTTSYSYSSSYDGYGIARCYPFLFIGLSIFFAGIVLIITSSIKMVNYVEMKKSLDDKKPERVQQVFKNELHQGYDTIRQDVENLKKMLEEGVLTEEEYAEMRAEVVRSIRTSR